MAFKAASAEKLIAQPPMPILVLRIIDLAFISHLFSRELPFLPIEQGANFATACLRYSSLNWYLRVARNLASRVGSVGALPPEVKRELKQVGVDEGLGVRQIGAQLYKGQIPDIERHSRRQL